MARACGGSWRRPATRRVRPLSSRSECSDGRTLYYKAFDEAGRSSFWAVSLAGGAPRLLVRFDDPRRPSSRAEFATDGRRLFFTIGTRQSDVWAMALRPP